MQRITASGALVAALTLSSFATAQNVWVVDDTPGPGVAFFTIQDAVNAASNGDVILVKTGTYGQFIINGKSLVITADTGQTVSLDVPLGATNLIQNIQFPQSVVIRGVRPASGGKRSAFTIDSCTGFVWFEDSFVYGTTLSNQQSLPGLTVVSSQTVVLRNTKVRGDSGYSYAGDPSQLATPGAKGIDATSSGLFLYESTSNGGMGGSGGFHATLGAINGANGGDALTLNGGEIYAQGATFTGGTGGLSVPGGSFGSQGKALDVSAATNQVVTYNGAAAGAVNILCPWTALTGPTVQFGAVAPVREGGNVDFNFNCGTPSTVYLFLADNPGPQFAIPGFYGPLLFDLLTSSAISFPSGPVCSGATTYTIVAPPVVPALASIHVVVQSLFTDAGLTYVHVGAPSQIILLDAAL
ncbi:MAG: hypothetical protein JNJ88_13325 [Planctomycetes bacterium]|nr:hypothetical protein [Planctomycetota bacterium]